MKRSAVLVLGTALLVACSTSSDQPSSASSTEGRSPAMATPSDPLTPGWDVSDGKVTTRADLAYWIVSYDAEWSGTGAPDEQKCVFKVWNQEGIVVKQTGETLVEGDDIEADTIYPDEVPGQPQRVTIECKSG